MTPYEQQYSTMHTFDTAHPTSPWTEPFQRAASMQPEDAASSFDTESQPTHDALTDIYNRGYRT